MNKEEILAMEVGEELDNLVQEQIFGLVPDSITSRRRYYKHYSTDISAAWQVMEKMRAEWNITMITGSLEIGRVVMHPLNRPEPVIEANAASMPEAICKATLIAKLAR